jgi:hypothetical protein
MLHKCAYYASSLFCSILKMTTAKLVEQNVLHHGHQINQHIQLVYLFIHIRPVKVTGNYKNTHTHYLVSLSLWSRSDCAVNL